MAHQDRFGAGQVDDGGGFERAGAAVDDQVELLFDALADVFGVVEHFAVAGQDQGAGGVDLVAERTNRFRDRGGFLQDQGTRLGDFVVRCFAPGVLQVIKTSP